LATRFLIWLRFSLTVFSSSRVELINRGRGRKMLVSSFRLRRSMQMLACGGKKKKKLKRKCQKTGNFDSSAGERCPSFWCKEGRAPWTF
jgi:hypothetical protein